MRFSVLILTFNEERNLPSCLAALESVDDVHVVDSGSQDDTVAIAERAGANVVFRPFDDFASQRNFGLETGRFVHDWVLHLDADEVMTPELLAEIAALDEPDDVDGFRIPSKTMFFGRWLRRSGMYPAYQVRLGHRERLRFIQVGHGQRESTPESRLRTLRTAYLHYSFSAGLTAWLAKHLRYAKDEAALCLAIRGREDAGEEESTAWGRRAMKRLSYRLPLWLRPFLRVLYVLVLRRGALDGWRGFFYAGLLGIYESMVAVLAYEQMLARGGHGNRPPRRPEQDRDS